ncbi:hypothetical protein [Pleionea mediterranea]|jgi:hypothetical protein|uniref:Uncharacterized protein n=1 Tax=Pleionea mediterranea TaxID=523701 RepID=A0A316FZQ9_9GAMM|nr:hypothetical protein [Pleionea mediterranea]PWK53872.1 hypothetical protein C8D97_102262 [Pleionea mediterranea]
MQLANKVTGMEQKKDGVDVHLEGEELKVDKMQKMADLCGPDGPGCNDDCCDEDFAARLKGVNVKGVDGKVTMHLMGALKQAEVANNLSRCNCYEP